MNILEMPGSERPRERLMKSGPEALSGVELLAVLLRTGSGGENGGSAIDAAAQLLASCEGNYLTLSNMSIEALCSHRGIGKAKAATLLAAFELGRRTMDAGAVLSNTVKVNSAIKAYETVASRLRGKTTEECWALFLARSNKLIKKEKMTTGDGSSTIMDVNRILKTALECEARAIVIAHNHPSGNPSPSEADIINTKTLHDAASSLGIDLLDHIIVCDNGFYSFSEEKNYFMK